MKNIDKGTRLTNYLIDLIAIYILWFVIIYISQSNNSDYFIFYSVMFLYYSVFENINGQTLGKIVTKTKVVNKNGTKPKFFRILIRSLSRIIPFDGFSYLFGIELGMHDLLSSTKLSKNFRATHERTSNKT